MEYKEVIGALEKHPKVYVVTLNARRSKFKVFFILDNELVPLNIPEIPCWSSTSYCYHVMGSGFDRVFELVYSISNYLFNDPYKLRYTTLN